MTTSFQNAVLGRKGRWIACDEWRWSSLTAYSNFFSILRTASFLDLQEWPCFWFQLSQWEEAYWWQKTFSLNKVVCKNCIFPQFRVRVHLFIERLLPDSSHKLSTVDWSLWISLQICRKFLYFFLLKPLCRKQIMGYCSLKLPIWSRMSFSRVSIWSCSSWTSLFFLMVAASSKMK